MHATIKEILVLVAGVIVGQVIYTKLMAPVPATA